VQDVKAADWKRKMHRRCGTSAEKQANFDTFLERFAGVLPRLPFQTNASSLEALLQLGDTSPGQLVLFFGALGKSFRVNMAPSFISFDYVHLYALFLQAEEVIPKALRWISHIYSQVLQIPAGASTQSFGFLSRNPAFCRERLGWSPQAEWLAAVTRIGTDIVRRIGCPSSSNNAVRYRVPMMCVLFDEKQLPAGHIWQGTFQTDGTAVCIRTLDIRSITYTDLIREKVCNYIAEKELRRTGTVLRRPAECLTVAETFEAAVVVTKTSFCTLESINAAGVPLDQQQQGPGQQPGELGVRERMELRRQQEERDSQYRAAKEDRLGLAYRYRPRPRARKNGRGRKRWQPLQVQTVAIHSAGQLIFGPREVTAMPRMPGRTIGAVPIPQTQEIRPVNRGQSQRARRRRFRHRIHNAKQGHWSQQLIQIKPPRVIKQVNGLLASVETLSAATKDSTLERLRDMHAASQHHRLSQRSSARTTDLLLSCIGSLVLVGVAPARARPPGPALLATDVGRIYDDSVKQWARAQKVTRLAGRQAARRAKVISIVLAWCAARRAEAGDDVEDTNSVNSEPSSQSARRAKAISLVLAWCAARRGEAGDGIEEADFVSSGPVPEDAREWSVQKLVDDTATAGCDTGMIFSLAVGYRDAVEDLSYSLLLSSSGLDSLRKSANRKQTALQAKYPVSLALLHAAIRQEEEQAIVSASAEKRLVVLKKSVAHHLRLIQSDPRYGRIKLDQYRMHSQMADLCFEQLGDALFPNIRRADRKFASPRLFQIGNGCEFDVVGRKNKIPLYANPLLRAIIRRMEGHKWPVLFVWVDEAYSSQVCPNPLCRRPPGNKWREQLETDGRCTEDNMQERADWPRSLVHYLRWIDSRGPVYRLLQCETCEKIWHRDVLAAFNIAQIGAHILVHGRHPYRVARAEVEEGS